MPVWDAGPQFQPRTAIGSLQLRGLYTYEDGGMLRKGGKFSVYDPYTCIPPLHLVPVSYTHLDVYKRQVIPVTDRNAYVNALEKASVGEDIAPFADFLAGLVKKLSLIHI